MKKAQKARKIKKVTAPRKRKMGTVGGKTLVLDEVLRCCLAARKASLILAGSSVKDRNRALESMADLLEKKKDDIIFKNGIDVEAAQETGLSPALIDRLTLNEERLRGMAEGLREMAKLPDPIGEIESDWTRPNGLRVQKVRVPLGVIGMIYESRPNVTVDSAGLCLKSGNAVVLRGGREAIDTNGALVSVIREAIASSGLPSDSVQFISTPDREAIRELVGLDRVVDLVIPRGGEEMVRAIRQMATVPVLSHGKGLCSVYVDKTVDVEMAVRIAFNSKVQRPGVCNAMETLLVHKDIAAAFLPRIAERYKAAQVEVRGDEETRRLIGSWVKPATDDDWDTEFLGLIAAVKVVRDAAEAIHHINRHGSHHSDSIVTDDSAAADLFLREVDSAAVFHNASTRLHDGSVFGLGAEMGISTQKLHARGTMGVRELTTTKYVVRGRGHIRE
ncbi:MAG TPA: glutamate-5-semialdehyde dehydrogenase [Elusimicrobiota bacterium]|nr:glutamate-5-semialdehyde dehydrogenase [Elusimicrobiota bacterium]